MAGQAAAASNPLRLSLINTVAAGRPVRDAYAFVTEHEIVAPYYSKLAAGESSREILSSLGFIDVPKAQSMMGTPGLFIIVAGGGVAEIPDAACVEEQLKRKSKPYRRKDIEDAFAACTNG